MALIYQITNTINGKIYIGQTKTSLYKRFRSHKSAYLQKKYAESCLYNAFKKYGTKSFIIQQIIEGDFSQDELNELEIEYIKKYNSLKPNGYNISEGGNCASKSLETRKKMSQKLKGREITWKDKVSIGVKKLWEDKEYRDRQTKQRHEKRGKYRDGIVKPLRAELPISDIVNLYQNGCNINQIAKKYNVGFETIKRRVCNNQKLRINGCKVFDIDGIKNDIKLGYSKKYITKKYDISYPTLAIKLKELN